MANPDKWYGMRYPDSELVGLAFRFARPEQPHLAAIDVGCGAGRHVRLLNELGYRAIGIDSDPKMAEMAVSNGLDARHADLREFEPPPRPGLVVAWGLMMLVGDAPELLARWHGRLVIADWRSEHNSCLAWPDNLPQADGSVILRRPGHTLHGQRYFFHRLDQCHLPGYQRIHCQRLTKTAGDETNDWYQTVHRDLAGAD